jgi:hypothetical protein
MNSQQSAASTLDSPAFAGDALVETVALRL